MSLDIRNMETRLGMVHMIVKELRFFLNACAKSDKMKLFKADLLVKERAWMRSCVLNTQVAEANMSSNQIIHVLETYKSYCVVFLSEFM